MHLGRIIHSLTLSGHYLIFGFLCNLQTRSKDRAFGDQLPKIQLVFLVEQYWFPLPVSRLYSESLRNVHLVLVPSCVSFRTFGGSGHSCLVQFTKRMPPSTHWHSAAMCCCRYLQRCIHVEGHTLSYTTEVKPDSFIYLTVK